MAQLKQHTENPHFWCTGEKDTLLRKLLIEAAPILQQIKPAMLVRISGCTCMDDTRHDHLFCRHQNEIVATLGLQHRILSQSETSVLVFFYAPALLLTHVTTPDNRAFLATLGYPNSTDLQTLLTTLENRFHNYGCAFPHEVGLFLGYPLKDVVGFLNNNTPVKTPQPTAWKIFGQPEPSLTLMARIREAREHVRKQLQHEPDVERFCLHLLQQRERAS